MISRKLLSALITKVPSSSLLSLKRGRSLATSAQKRKWSKEQVRDKSFVKQGNDAATKATEDGIVATTTKIAPVNWQPLFFLGVFPVFLSIAVVLNRDDLRDEVNDKGIGRFLEDYKRWRRVPPQATLPSTGTEQQQHRDEEHESEYDKMIIQRGGQKHISTSSTTRRNSSNP